MCIDVPAVAGLAARAELGWRDADGVLRATAIVPLVIDGAVSAALPFAEAPLARHLATATSAVVVCSDSRMARRGWTPFAVPVRITVTPDRTGDWTWSGALDQEVRKYPPSQLLIDTAIQRREHWWYVPRWIVRLDPVGRPAPVARRGGPDDGLLFLVRPGRHTTGPTEPVSAGPADDALGVVPVAVDGWDEADVALTPLDADRPLPRPSGRRALLFTHDFAIPDQERASALAVTGTLDGRRLHVEARVGERTLDPPRLVARLLAHARFGRACRRELAAYDSASADAR